MPRKLSKKTVVYRRIKELHIEGLNGNQIGKQLRKEGLGVRNKRLYAEIRSLENRRIDKEKSLKSIPKKYRKKSIGGGILRQEPLKLFRGSLIISSVPLHSSYFDRRYLGFRLNVFSLFKENIGKALDSMKQTFLEMVSDELESFTYAKEQTIGTEKATEIYLTNPENYAEKWFFEVEENGRSQKGKGRDGFI